VYRGQLKALDDIWDYAFFVTFFPQMVAGPIVRAHDFVPQIHRPLMVSREDFGRGVFLFCTGLFKKAVISDYISLNFVDRVFDSPAQYSGLENLEGVYGYALQIYCDFSGYTDMAIGIGLLLGFHFPINFNSPYRSLSVTEFWRRWHISLSSWFKDYVYIPLGGNQKGNSRWIFNLLLVFLRKSCLYAPIHHLYIPQDFEQLNLLSILCWRRYNQPMMQSKIQLVILWLHYSKKYYIELDLLFYEHYFH
jgi:D-alanyl-lipoteichoic acid acyltransferase DltB (MBOAT superfamily)